MTAPCVGPQWKVPLGGIRITSPDVRYGHPWPSLSRRNLRFALRAALAFYAVERDTDAPELPFLVVRTLLYHGFSAGS